jgi:hypothetical protein
MRTPALASAALGLGLLCLPLPAQDRAQNNDNAAPASGVRLQGAEKEGGRRIRLGGVSVGAAYTRGWPGYGWWGPRPWGPAWYPAAYSPLAYPGWGWYDPFWYSPLAVHPGYWMGFSRGEGMGEVKLDTETKTASLYIDGAYAGPAKDRRNLWLRPGTYEIQVRDGDKELFAQRIYVLSGKTLRIRPEPAAAGEEVTR